MIPLYLLTQFFEEQVLNAMSIEQVKSLWDEYDGCNTPGGVSGESIHLNLNQRGHGYYCAI